MRADWRRIHDEIVRRSDPESPEDEEQRAEVFREFLERHESTLAAMKMSPDKANAAMLEAQRQFLEADAEVKRVEEALLQARANEAERSTEWIVAMLQQIEKLEAMSEEDWDALEFDHRVRVREALEMLRENREDFLSELPLELRTEWERRLGS